MASDKPVQASAEGHAPIADCLRASPRLFDNWILDKLSRVHWSMPLCFYVPLVVFLAGLSFETLDFVTICWTALSGYVVWTLTEYFGHRYLFHTEFPGTWGARFHFLLHGVHHAHPSDPLRLVMPPLMSAPIMILAFLLTIVLVGRPLAYPVFMGFVIGYLIYDMVHYSLHHIEFKSRGGRNLRRLHMSHHFHDAERGFAISAPWWDKIFGTAQSSAQ